MCKRNRHYSGRAAVKWKFQKHLRVYLLVNGIMMFTAWQGDGQVLGWLPVAFFWGIGLFVHYLRAYRPWVSGALSREWERRLLAGEQQDRDELELRRLRPKRKAWDERDLV